MVERSIMVVVEVVVAVHVAVKFLSSTYTAKLVFLCSILIEQFYALFSNRRNEWRVCMMSIFQRAVDDAR